MYERSYGYRYNELGDHPAAAEIAKAIRRDIKQAVEEGLLPERWTYSVTSDHGSTYQSVDIEVRNAADAWQPCDGTVPGSEHVHPDGSRTATACSNVWCAARNDPAYADGATTHDVLTEEARVAKLTLERIHGAYNHDGSEIQVDYFDVRYYGHVEFESADTAAWRAKEKERKAAKKAAKESARVVGRIENYGRDGRGTVHVLKETDEGKQVLACGARVWRGGIRQRVADDTPVTCSRCQKALERVAA